MERNEIIQWTVVGIILLCALVWASLKVASIGKKKNNGCECGCCESSDCKLRELKGRSHPATSRKQKHGNCRDGLSDRN